MPKTKKDSHLFSLPEMKEVRFHTNPRSPFVADYLDGLYAEIDALAKEPMSTHELTTATLKKVSTLLSDAKIKTGQSPTARTEIATRWLAARRVMAHADKKRAKTA